MYIRHFESEVNKLFVVGCSQNFDGSDNKWKANMTNERRSQHVGNLGRL